MSYAISGKTGASSLFRPKIPALPLNSSHPTQPFHPAAKQKDDITLIFRRLRKSSAKQKALPVTFYTPMGFGFKKHGGVFLFGQQNSDRFFLEPPSNSRSLKKGLAIKFRRERISRARLLLDPLICRSMREREKSVESFLKASLNIY